MCKVAENYFKWIGILRIPYLSYKQIRELISGG